MADKFDIKTIDPHPTEAIVLFFNVDEIDSIETVCNKVKELEEKFPTNTIMALPDHMSLQSLSKDVLENYISMISEAIEKL